MGLHSCLRASVEVPTLGTDGRDGACARVSTNTHNNLITLTRLGCSENGPSYAGVVVLHCAAWRVGYAKVVYPQSCPHAPTHAFLALVSSGATLARV